MWKIKTCLYNWFTKLSVCFNNTIIFMACFWNVNNGRFDNIPIDMLLWNCNNDITDLTNCIKFRILSHWKKKWYRKNSFAIFSNAAKDGKYQNYGKSLINLLLILVLTAFCSRSSSIGFSVVRVDCIFSFYSSLGQEKHAKQFQILTKTKHYRDVL